MWPSFTPKTPTLRNLFGLEGNIIYGIDGKTLRLDTYYRLKQFLHDNMGTVYTDSLTDFIWLHDAVMDEKSKVLCTRRGEPLAVMLRVGRSMRWIIKTETWGEKMSIDFLSNMWDLFEYCNVGFAVTPGSLGMLLMKQVHSECDHKKHTSLSLACEDFLTSNCVGGIVHYPCVGKSYDRLVQLDETSAYLSKYTYHPDGAGVLMKGHNDRMATYFAECEVRIKEELPLGPFPTRHKRRVSYKTLPGKYTTYLWKEQVIDCINAGCEVKVGRGWGWRSFTRDNEPWANKIYWMRKEAPTEFIEKQCKVIAVAAIGKHAVPRERYFMVPEEEAGPECPPIVNKDGEPMIYFVKKEEDKYSPVMKHWNYYTVMLTNSEVYNFGLPFAVDGRLVAVDYDSVLVTEHDEVHRFIRRLSPESFRVPPGTWTYTILNNVTILAARSYKSDEKVKRPGVPLNQREEVYT